MATKNFIAKTEKELAQTKIDDTPEGIWCIKEIADKIRNCPIQLSGNSKTAKTLTNFYKNQVRREIKNQKDDMAMIGAGNSDYIS